MEFGFPRKHSANCFVIVLVTPRLALWFYLRSQLFLSNHPRCPPFAFSLQMWILPKHQKGPWSSVGRIPTWGGLGHLNTFSEKPLMFLLSTGDGGYFWLTFHDLHLEVSHLRAIGSFGQYFLDVFCRCLLWVCLLWTFRIDGIIQCETSCDWLCSLSMVYCLYILLQNGQQFHFP